MCVYFFSDGRKLKVGYSKAPQKRLSHLQTGSSREIKPIMIIENGCRNLEKVFHDFLKAKGKHHRLEWFYFDDEVKNYLIDLYRWKKRSPNQFLEGVYTEIQHERSWKSKALDIWAMSDEAEEKARFYNHSAGGCSVAFLI